MRKRKRRDRAKQIDKMGKKRKRNRRKKANRVNLRGLERSKGTNK